MLSSTMYFDQDLLLNPILKHGLSMSSHIVLFFVLVFAWFWNRKTPIRNLENSYGSKSVYYKACLYSCWSFSVVNLVLCVSNYLYWHRDGWSDDDLFKQFDLVLRMLAWAAISCYLSAVHSDSKFPIFLKIWWGFFLILSCFILVTDIVFYSKYKVLHIWISDVISVVAGSLLCLAASFGKNNNEDSLREPLLIDAGNTIASRDDGENISPLTGANFFSLLTFYWLNSFLALGHKKTINHKDIPQLYRDDSVRTVFPAFRTKLDSYGANSGEVSSGKLAMALIFSAWKEIVLTGVLSFLCTCFSYVGPFLIEFFVHYLNSPHRSKFTGYGLVFGFIFSQIIESVTDRHTVFKLEQVTIRVNAALVAAIYRKVQTLSSHSRQIHSTGEIVNFMAVDASRVSYFSPQVHDWWKIPIQIFLALLILYRNLGFLATVAASITTALVVWATVPLGKQQQKLQGKLMESKDERMKATSEILKNMKILKLQGWEMKFLSKIFEVRHIEEGWLRKYVYANSVSTFIFYGGPTLVSVVTFAVCVPIGVPLETGKVLSAIATFGILKKAIYSLPQTLSSVTQTRTSLDRIASFLSLEDLQPDMIEKLPSHSKFVIEINNGSFTWDLSSSDAPTLKHINLQVYRGMRVGLCGTVGSGKSSLLSCILGEMTKVSGNIKLVGTKAYVAQSPWIQSGNVEQNILFGKEMDRERYERILEACSLKKDLELLSFGDQTVIGERGINLSGGQKQRIQIARALYQDADIYLFDDPFSALDAHTGMHLYEECLLRFLESKTVVYTTNQVEFLPSADLILVLKDGMITQSGKYDEILATGTDFMELVGAHKKALHGHSNSGLEDGVASDREGNPNAEDDFKEDKKEIKQNHSITDEEVQAETQEQLVQDEERGEGKVGLKVYWKYITTAYGGLLVLVVLVAQIIFQGLQIGSNYWMAWNTPVSKDAKSLVETSTLILVYTALGLGSCIFVLIRSIATATAGYKTATILFKRMHLSIFRAPMSFFDATPSGRILSRVSSDQGDLDMNLPAITSVFAVTTIALLGVIAVMAQGAWQVCIIYIPVTVACNWYQKFYIAGARELVRLFGVSSAPLKQHFAESLSGLTTIRSFDQEPRFMDTNMKLIDSSSQPDFYGVSAMQWLGFRLDMLSTFTFALTLVFLISMPHGVIDPAIAGLAVTYGLNLNTLQAYAIWILGILEGRIIAVERILQYSCIPSEPPLIVDAHRPHHSWPSHGEVTFHNLQVRYAPHLPFILRGLSCTFPGQLKTGIVGRTGSGKSTLIQTLFRIMEPAGGKILIDGVDISTIGLHDLRSKLSIIPQEPTMFQGTVRSNLDPLEEYTDEQIWEALDKCQLGDEVRKKEDKLDASVTENGENWSMGQRQLVCLGRVVLKKSKILVLDEATSSVDTATDNLMQKTLRQHFSDSTVITIAHRITSVLDSDMVLVLDNGRILEHDTPKNLLENKCSSFARLVNEQFQASRS
ncbi:hypothetical protein ACHQM5_003555 [Ranunculus cassubicifolius]